MSSTRRTMKAGFLGFTKSGMTSIFNKLIPEFEHGQMTDVSTDDVNIRTIATDDTDMLIWDLNVSASVGSDTVANTIANSQLIFIVYDVTNASSLMPLPIFYRMVLFLADCDCKIVLLGNKVDMKDRFILKATAESIQHSYSLDSHLEVSTRDDALFGRFVNFFKQNALVTPEAPVETTSALLTHGL